MRQVFSLDIRPRFAYQSLAAPFRESIDNITINSLELFQSVVTHKGYYAATITTRKECTAALTDVIGATVQVLGNHPTNAKYVSRLANDLQVMQRLLQGPWLTDRYNQKVSAIIGAAFIAAGTALLG